MNDKQRYYASLERQRTAETQLRGSGQSFQENNALDDLYADMGMRAFAAFQNCLDWLGSIGSKRTVVPDGGGQIVDKAVADTLGEMADALLALKEQVGRLETAVANMEAGMRRIDKYTLDAFRQLSEMDAARVVQAQQQTHVEEQQGNRRLAKDEAVRLAIEAAERMAKAGQQLSLAAVAREAGLKYGQIVYAFGNKDTFLARLAAISGAVGNSHQDGVKSPVQTEVAAAVERETAS